MPPWLGRTWPGSAIPGAVALLVVVTAGYGPRPGAAQSIKGRVVLDGWGEPVPGARIVLLDSALTPLDSTTAGPQGQFAFRDVGAGMFQLQAGSEGQFSSLAGPVALRRSDEIQEVRLFIPSPLLRLATACFRGDSLVPGTGVLVGVVYEPETDMAVPGASVVVQWDESGGLRGEAAAIADEAGRFALCAVPSGKPLAVWIRALGAASRGDTTFTVAEHMIARLDLPLKLEGNATVRVVRGAEGEGTTPTVLGRVVDAETGDPIGMAEVVMRDLDRRIETDARGRFLLDDVPPGAHTIEVQRLGYDLPLQTVDIPAAASVELELRVSPEALALEPLVARAQTVEQRTQLAVPFGTHVVAGGLLKSAEIRGASVPDVLRDMPGIFVHYGTFETTFGRETGACIESRRALPAPPHARRYPDIPWCDAVTVVLDGVVMTRPVEIFRSVRLEAMESIEYLSPLGAIRWGLEASATGAIVLWTRGHGPHASHERH